MDSSLYYASLQGFLHIMHLEVWLAMLVGVGIGTFTAVAPQGFGTPLVYALLLPIVIKWQPLTGIALLIGASAVSAICAAYLPILFGIPGGAGSQATVLDGYPMGRKGEARRALGASFMAGGMGALIGTPNVGIFCSSGQAADLSTGFTRIGGDYILGSHDDSGLGWA